MTTFDEFMRAGVANKTLPGAVLVATNSTGTFRYERSFGHGGIKPDSQPLALDSTFWIASCTKLMTLVCVLQCVEKGLFSLDSHADIKRLLPEVVPGKILTGFEKSTGSPEFQDAKNEITLRHMLTHTAGLGYDAFDPPLQRWRKSRGERQMSLSGDVIRGYAIPQLFEAGEEWNYSGGVDLAGLMVERANHGIKLGEYMKEHIWKPLGMKSTCFHLESSPEILERLSELHLRLPTGGLRTVPHMMMSPATDDLGGAGSYSCASDYIKVLTSILRDDGKLLSKEKGTVEDMFRPQFSGKLKEAWQHAMKDPALNNQMTGGLPLIDQNWGLAGFIVNEDLDGMRRKGSMAWGGLPNIYWWIDRSADVCGLYMGAIVPPGDPVTLEYAHAFEKEVYRVLACISKL